MPQKKNQHTTRVRRAERKNIAVGQAHIKSTFNNTIISITDPAGNVIAADIGKGTNIDNASMRRSAVEAARRAKFNSIEGTNNQSGTITYMFRLK